ncbi:hypothetical protein WJX73_010283 [Symbiochloris irregularis]|uniref:Uncharacterized protein n=1 Tax=Symbiochloris irregularis TaxID=706552 RepID=A0AAW1P096_9CHLO
MHSRLGSPPLSSCQLRAKNNSVFKQKGKGKLNVVRNGTEVSSNHRCCAERRLLQSFIDQAKRHGIPSHAQTAWDDAWFSGRMCSTAAPKAKLTTGQRRHLHLNPKPLPAKKQL